MCAPDWTEIWNLEVVASEERGKLECLEKNLPEQGRELTTKSTHIHKCNMLSHIGGRPVLSPCCTTLAPCKGRNNERHSGGLNKKKSEEKRWNGMFLIRKEVLFIAINLMQCHQQWHLQETPLKPKTFKRKLIFSVAKIGTVSFNKLC